MAGSTRARRASAYGSRAGSARSSTARSRRPKSSWQATGCGRGAPWGKGRGGASARPSTLERKEAEIGRAIERAHEGIDLDAAIEEEVGDDLLGLIFMACHPVLSKDARVALTLRVLGGLTTEEIARAFLVPVSTIAQRIVRAKRTLTEAHVRFEFPVGPERVAPLASVREVIHLTLNEGHSAAAGEDGGGPALCEDALRLGRILAELAPTEPEVHGLVALMEIQASRLRARVGPSDEPILLLEQDRARW